MSWPQYKRGEATIDGHVVVMTRRVTDLLLLILLRRNIPTTYDQAIEWLWPDPDFEPESAYTLISKMLAKLRKLGIPIDTRLGVGFFMPL